MSSYKHPEMLPGEVFVSNCRFPDHWLGEIPDEELLSFPTRKGILAYNTKGELIVGYYPIFATRRDLIEWGRDPDDPIGLADIDARLDELFGD